VPENRPLEASDSSHYPNRLVSLPESPGCRLVSLPESTRLITRIPPRGAPWTDSSHYPNRLVSSPRPSGTRSVAAARWGSPRKSSPSWRRRPRGPAACFLIRKSDSSYPQDRVCPTGAIGLADKNSSQSLNTLLLSLHVRRPNARRHIRLTAVGVLPGGSGGDWGVATGTGGRMPGALSSGAAAAAIRCAAPRTAIVPHPWPRAPIKLPARLPRAP
jgi:hypothetical protein